MKYMTKKTLGVLLAALLSLGVMAPAAMALTVNLTASETTLTMPDGTDVFMWGYVLTGSGDTPFDSNNPPVIRALTTDTLTINLTNSLPITNPALVAETSLVIPGQNDTTMAPVFFTDPQLRQRVQSFTHETAAAATGVYTWNSLQAGTYLIQSGTHPSVQVPMGLYAVLIVDQGAAGTAYTTGAGPITYNSDVPLLFSEVDSLQHLAVTNGDYGTPAYATTMAAGYGADYFLINGQPFSSDRTPVPAGANGDNILLRFLNAGLRIREPVIQGGHINVIAEDGNAFTAIGATQQQYSQYSVDLAAGKTMDALFAPATDGYYPVYDRRLGLTNNNAPGPGGMMTFLEVGTPNQTLDVAFDGASTGTGTIQAISAPGGIDSAAGDLTEDFLVDTAVTLRATPDPNSALTGWVVSGGTGECQAPLADPYGDCVVTMDANKTVTATFTSYLQATVITPDGGENIPAGSGYTIRWGAPVTDMTFNLAYSFGAGTPWQTIATGVSGNQYVWTVPVGVPNHGDLFIAVTGYNSGGLKTSVDISDAAATRYANALTAPNGLETWTGPQTITWDSSLVPGTTASIGLWYQTDSVSPWQLITVLQTDSGFYDWAIPGTIPTTATAKVGLIFYDALGEPLYIDSSDNVFTIN